MEIHFIFIFMEDICSFKSPCVFVKVTRFPGVSLPWKPKQSIFVANSLTLFSKISFEPRSTALDNLFEMYMYLRSCERLNVSHLSTDSLWWTLMHTFLEKESDSWRQNVFSFPSSLKLCVRIPHTHLFQSEKEGKEIDRILYHFYTTKRLESIKLTSTVRSSNEWTVIVTPILQNSTRDFSFVLLLLQHS